MRIFCYLAIVFSALMASGCVQEVNTSHSNASKAYILNELSNSVSVVGLQVLSQIKELPVGAGPVSAAINRTTGKLYVANHAGNMVTVIDTKTDAVLTTVATGDYPLIPGIDLARNKIYVPAVGIDGEGTLTVIDGQNNGAKLLGAVDGVKPAGPRRVIVDEDNARVYIGYTSTAADGKNYVTVMDTRTDSYIADVEVCGPWADGMAVNRATGAVVVTSGRDLSNHCVSRVAADYSVSHISGIEQPWVVRRFSNSVDERFYVTAYAGATVYELKGSPLSVSASIQVGTNPRDLQINPDTNRIYVSNEGSNTVSVIDANTNLVISTIEVGLSPRNLRIDRAANNVLVANYASGSVSVIDGETAQVMATIAVGSGPRAIIIQ